MAHRYFAARIEGDTAFLKGADANHLARVLRARPGDEVILCDGAGTDCDAVVESADPDTVRLRITARRPCTAEPPFAVTVFAGYPKQDKLETIIQKSVELGAAAITPFFSRFCVAAPKNEDKKNARYARIAAEAAKQCGRGMLPAVSMPLTVAQLCQQVPRFDKVLFFYEKGGQPLRQAALPAPPAGGSAALITGLFTLSAGAAGATQVTAQLSPQLTIVVDGVSRDFYTVAGVEAHPITYNGTTYVPVRAISEAMGLDVSFNSWATFSGPTRIWVFSPPMSAGRLEMVSSSRVLSTSWAFSTSRYSG